MNASNIKFARPKASGVFYSAATTATAPTTASSTLGVGFTELGYVSEDGLVETIDHETTELKDMGGDVVAIWDDTHSVSYKLTPMEFTAAVLEEILGSANVTLDNDSALQSAILNSDMLPNRMFVFDMRLSDTSLMRIVVPNGKITAIGDMTYKKGQPMMREITIVALPDSSGNKAYEYFAAAA